MSAARYDASTIDLSRSGRDRVLGGGELIYEPVPILTILFHPQAWRVGDRAFLGQILQGVEASLSRLEPDFEEPGVRRREPLNDPYLSRRPIRFRPAPGGGIELRLGDSRTRVVAAGEAVEESRVFSAAEVHAGVVLEIAGRVVLLLHLFVPSAVSLSETHGLIGESTGMGRVRTEIHLVADLNVPVLIRGESGTGKELVARALHAASPRRSGPFVSINLGAIPPSLAASELFGAARGAFTGSVQSQDGYFRRAHGGTLFLDEVGETPQEVQASLLRALETGEIQPVGAQTVQRVDVRLVAATDADLEQRVEGGLFRAPLLHRLAGYSVWLPPLRERRDDIGRLLVCFLREELAALGEPDRLEAGSFERLWMPPALMVRLVRSDWPGNVRQLRNAVRQLAIGSRGLPQLQASPGLESLLSGSRPVELPASAVPAPGGRRKPSEVSQEELLDALRANRWRLKSTAEQLGISRPSLYVLIERCPAIRKAGDLPVDEILRCHRECNGDLDAMVERLMVSRDALHRRVRELGLD
jgi:two-component system nitrogen regulation response regulator GlnG